MATQKTEVPESVLKFRALAKEKEEDRYKAARQLVETKQKNKQEILKRTEQYEAEYEAREKDLIEQRRKARFGGNFFREPEPKIAFVVRIKGILKIAPQPKKILQLLRLRQIQNGVFVKLNGATLRMLKLVDPYVMWGYPNLKTVRELIYKRGYLRLDGCRIPITDNVLVQRKLAKYNILSVEDLVHEIFTCGPHFKEANSALWPFKLTNPKGGYKRKRNHFVEGGDAGNREKYINNMVRKMI
eukprot:TRINITY_DN655_c0_g2_i3.p1 TRINITY_DN655_c0_g2~~TRINITY_DN655_c0_g2_i3.p1  ORF type:complete len:243 (+),score=49.15 TRINITY_DN655_c0_g2_i3:112-840(+)